MTSGSSQGLFVIIAVIIFGIFVVISYLLFRDKLQTGLASIFTDSITKSKENLVPYTELKDIIDYYSTTSLNEKGEYTVEMKENPIIANPSGFHTKNNIRVPYGYRLYIYFEVYTEEASTVSIDLNSYTDDSSKGWSTTNDNYGTVSNNKRNDQKNYAKTLKNTWNNIEFWYENNHEGNVDKLDIIDKSSFGIKSTEISKFSTYKIRNIKYKVVKL